MQERARLSGHLQAFADEQGEQLEEGAGTKSKMPLHPADLGSDVQHEALEATLATRRSAELREIEAAFERLTSTPDQFGIDENTGAEIPFERLDVIPYARIAVDVHAPVLVGGPP